MKLDNFKKGRFSADASWYGSIEEVKILVGDIQDQPMITSGHHLNWGPFFQ